MNIDFQCGHCGKRQSINSSPGVGIKCSNCGKETASPQAVTNPPEVIGSTTMAKGAPWLISILFHFSLIIVLAMTTMMAGGTGPVVTETTIIPIAEFSENPNDGTISPSSPSRAGPTESAGMANRGQAEFQNNNAAIDSGALKGNDISVTGAAVPSGTGTGGGSSGNGSIGLPGGGVAGEPGLFGKRGGGNVYHVVYVIDRSGSMFDTFDNLRAELIASIAHLKPSQDFHIIFFSQGLAVENQPKQLVEASNEQKTKAVEFLTGISASSKTDPLPALRRAFDVLDKIAPGKTDKPGKLIYLLTDGVFPDNGAVFQLLHDRNARKDVHISTFNYGSRSPVAIQVLTQIANDYGGNYTYLDMDK